MNYLIGIDGGGTNTKCILADINLNVIARSSGGATNPLSAGFEKSAGIISKLISQVSKKNKSGGTISIAAGIAGCGRKAHAYKLETLLRKKLKLSGIVFKNLKIVSDAEIAFEGALNGKQGALLIAGTGSILIGKDKPGNLFKIGGYGKLTGDEGSGYSIGRKGLNAVSKYLDGRGGETKLAGYLSKYFEITNRDELITKVYSEDFNIAEIAPMVLTAAKNGDKFCRKILDGEINELILHVEAFQKKINEEELSIVLSGGLLKNKNYYSQEFKNRIAKQVKRIKIKRAKYTPEIGAVILAKKN